MNKREAKKLIKDVLSSKRRTFLEPEAKKLISAWGISTPKSVLIKNKKDIEAKANKLTPPYVLKVVSQDILHKSEAGGVVTDIKNIKELNNVWTKMAKNISHKMPTARIEGYLLEEMFPRGIEVIIGGLRDPQFGPAVMFGIGGIAVELMKDVSFRLAPLDKNEAIDMMKDVKSYPLLTGFRGSKPVDLENIASAIIKLSKILIEADDIKEIEINPFIAHEKGIMAADVRVVLNDKPR